MSIAKHMKNLMDIDLDGPSNPPQDQATDTPPKPNPKPTTAPSQLASFSTEFKRVSDEAEVLRKTRGEAMELNLDLLDSSEFQTRALDKNKVEELVANLSANPLATPITVRRKASGRFEIVAGHHRVEAFRILGRKSIPVIIIQASDDEAERMVFYDNLLAPTLSDYDRFLGFQARKKRHNLSDIALADEAGVSRSLVQALMSFARLPEGVLEILHEHRDLIGSTLAVKMAGLDKKFTSRMIEATNLLREGELKQARVIQWIEGGDKQGEQAGASQPAPVVVRNGRQTYAKVVRGEKKLTITWADPDEVAGLEEEIANLLRKRAEQLRRAALPDAGGADAAGEAAQTK